MTEQPMRVMFYDIEATNLKADYGYTLCVSWKWEGEKKVHHLAITDCPTFTDDPTNDKWIIEEFTKEVEKADVIVGHYASRFDYPFLQTRALYHGLPILPRAKWVDTWRVARDNLHLSSNRLASIAHLLGVEEKTPLSGPIWIKAMAGHKPSIKYVVQHCDQDVVVLEQVYQRIKGLRNDNPNLAPRAAQGCPTCGGENTIKKGFDRTVKKMLQIYKCKDCGHTFRKPK